MPSGLSSMAGVSVVGADRPLTIVLLHGVFFSRGEWSPQVALLSTKYRVVAVDLPGHGDLADVGFTLEGAADRVAQVLTAIDGEAPVLVGWSLGGFVAMEVAARRPASVRGLVLAGASFEPSRYLNPVVRIGVRLLSHSPRRPSAKVAYWVSRVALGGPVTSVLFSCGAFIPQGMRALATLPGFGFADRVRTYAGPTLVLNGSRDWVARSQQQVFCKASPLGQVRVLDRAGHHAPLQRPNEFSRSVIEFCDGLDGHSE